MESRGPTALPSVASTTTIAVRTSSKIIAVTYVGGCPAHGAPPCF
jgi:hypothetical protein